MNLPWTHAGVPAMTLPAGWIDDLPIGLQLISQFDHDERLFSYATQIASDLDLNC
jgi:Asp-tRNA(Asn)/Glu-tRNA(Gln) amidotransferase A subunit family amidase